MATTRIKERLSTLVSSQLPEFVQGDYPTFVAFLEAYYQFLEQDQGAHELLQNARSYNDIDRTVDSFVEYFLKQYCNDIPRTALYNKKALIKNIQDLYNNKGNEKSYRLLFRILYNKEIEFFYPRTQVLKASDGKWVQRTSFFMKTLVGDGLNIVNNNILISSSTTEYPILITSRKNAMSSTGVSSDIHEYFFDNIKNVPINIGDIIEYTNKFKGEVIGVPTSASVTKSGSGFNVGDILTLTSGPGKLAKLKVTKTNTTGGIVNVQFINFGIDYIGNFYNFFSPIYGKKQYPQFDFSNNNASISDKFNGFIENGTITKPSYSAEMYFAEDYQGELILNFFNSTSSIDQNNILTSSEGTGSDAAIFIKNGSKAIYPGYYESSDGFLSETNFLSDRDYYQPFSYVIKIDELLLQYKKVVLDILHPSGTKLFGELLFDTKIDTILEVTTSITHSANYLHDTIIFNDNFTYTLN